MSDLRVGQILKNCAVDGRPSGARSVATADERCHRPLQCLQLGKFLAQMREVLGGDVADLQARALWLVDEADEFTHLFDRETEVPTAPNEGETPHGGFAVYAPTAFRSRAGQKQTNLLVVPDRRY